MLTNINGRLGSGKTLFMTYLASKVKDRPIYANYGLRLPNYQPLKLTELMSFKQEKALILVDEAYVLIESRASMDKLNQYISYILFQSRKRQLDFIVTAQLNSTLDLRYKDLTDVNIVAQKNKNSSCYQYAISFGGRMKVFDLPFREATKYYNLYDTTELVIPPRMDDMVDELENLDPDTLNKKVNNAVKLIEQQFGTELADAKRITHNVVLDWLLQLHEPSSVAPYVYARLNTKKRK